MYCTDTTDLIEKSIDIDVEDKEGLTPLQRACEEGSNEVVKVRVFRTIHQRQVLLEAGANAKHETPDGRRPGHRAAACKNADTLLPIMMKTDPEIVSVVDSKNASALLYAAAAKNVSIFI